VAGPCSHIVRFWFDRLSQARISAEAENNDIDAGVTYVGQFAVTAN
jgi:hypothetical protein